VYDLFVKMYITKKNMDAVVNICIVNELKS